MPRTIISILSDQLIPNILFIKQWAKKGDSYVFLSSLEMEKKHKSRILVNTLNIGKDNFKTIIIDQNSPSKILKVLEQEFPKNSVNQELVINITGGTKMMSQMTYFHFWGFEHTKIFYWPIGEKYVEQLHPEIKRIEMERPVQLNLKTYFKAYGYNFIKAEELRGSFEKSENLFQKVVHSGDSALVPEIARASHEDYRKKDKPYFTGGWFEEWLYFTLKKELKLKESEIGLNLKIKNEASKRAAKSDNELDVVFVYKNTLYILECKVYSAKQLSRKRITDAIYKISSVRQSLGLRAIAMVFILSSFGESRGRQNTVRDLMRMANVKQVFSLKDMKNKESFLEKIKMMVNHE